MSADTLSLPEAARRFGISERTARNLAKTGQLCEGVPVLRLGSRLVVSKAQVDRVLGMQEAS